MSSREYFKGKVDGAHEAIKDIIKEIEEIEWVFQSCGNSVSQEFSKLKDNLGRLVYRDWPDNDEDRRLR
jgi:hypothetical protein